MTAISRKQTLLKRHRRNKRIGILLILMGMLGLAAWLSWWLLPPGLLLTWLIHEAAFADHLFYSPKEDYRYRFPAETPRLNCSIRDGRLLLPAGADIAEIAKATLILKLQLRSSLLGHWFDPGVAIGDDMQSFERGMHGLRYLNLSGQGETLQSGTLRIAGRYCQLPDSAELYLFPARPVPARTMILAPHADDAELAAFGLYSSSAKTSEVSIITLTQGEIEAEHFRRLGKDMGLSKAEAARLKGRLRSWDSRAIPLWGGVPASHCIQLGYYCLRLKDMQAAPDTPFASRESADSDIRPVRQQNPISLPADSDGQPTWSNLVADLIACIEHYRPERIILPHPELDPHSDHIATGQALQQALEQLAECDGWQPKEFFLYANHLHDNDRWPMGESGTGVALPPAFIELPADAIHCQLLGSGQQFDKAMALRMQHDLQSPLPIKKRMRRFIQSALLGRRWPATGEDEFMRKTVRRHELFWVREKGNGSSDT